jgi:hypothetical protein
MPAQTTQQKKDQLAAHVEELYQLCGRPVGYAVLSKPRNQYTIKHLQRQIDELMHMAAEMADAEFRSYCEQQPEPTPEAEAAAEHNDLVEENRNLKMKLEESTRNYQILLEKYMELKRSK